jgi:hypothetical protein
LQGLDGQDDPGNCQTQHDRGEGGPDVTAPPFAFLGAYL